MLQRLDYKLSGTHVAPDVGSFQFTEGIDACLCTFPLSLVFSYLGTYRNVGQYVLLSLESLYNSLVGPFPN